MIYTVTLNPALDKTVEIPSLTIGAVNRIVSMRTDPGGKGINVSKVIRKLGGKALLSEFLAAIRGERFSRLWKRWGSQPVFILQRERPAQI